MPNRLAHETSPYLLQHKDNPVDWYAWGNEAFTAARERDVPILLSVGYSTCHWCHVMAHESFEDEEIARLINDSFVAIKVDREERPDVDAIYMQSAQAMGNQGGWPLSVFLTPDGHPFFSGTYWPRLDHPSGMPGFSRVLMTMAHMWSNDRAKLVEGGQQIANYLRETAAVSPSPDALDPSLFENAVNALRSVFDAEHGGFGGAPKFPQQSVLAFLVREYARSGNNDALNMVRATLEAMAEGGIHDHLAGGFARYSVDAEWHVPHFEKMLYDNAQLLELYADLTLATGDPLFRETGIRIVGWLQDEMIVGEGGFASAQDADSEGQEGKFAVWTEAEVDTLLDPDAADLIKRHFGIDEPGTFEGANVLRIAESAEEIAADLDLSSLNLRIRIAELKEIMLKARRARVQPGRDGKVIAGWNGMMIHALASAAPKIGIGDWVTLAERAATFVLDNLRRKDGSLARSWADGHTRGEGVLEDYASLSRGLISLYSASDNTQWLTTASELFDHAREHFRHESGTGYYDTTVSSTDLIVRPREMSDGATPSGNALMVEVGAILATLREDQALMGETRAIAESMCRPMREYPQSLGFMLAASERIVSQPRDIIVSGDRKDSTTAALHREAFLTGGPMAIIGAPSDDDAIAEQFPMLGPRSATDAPAAFVCQAGSCLPPITDVAELRETLTT